jgi:glycosyltransferase involved in cell wall biosynthesis
VRDGTSVTATPTSSTANRPRVALVAAAANRGGAHVAALRLHQGLLDAGVDSRFVAGIVADGVPVAGPPSPRWRRDLWRVRSRVSRWIAARFGPQPEGMQSLNVLPSGLAHRLNADRLDAVHLHWVNNELLSIAEIGRIRHPMVWTLHDMWAFCGSEHYLADPSAYLGPPGSAVGAGVSQMARWTWERKRRAWASLQPIIVAPSRWLGDLASRSRLLGHLPVEIVPYGLDLDCFRPPSARERDASRPFRIVFGAAGGSADPRKGFDLFVAAMGRLAETFRARACELVFFGSAEPPRMDPVAADLRVCSAGIIRSDAEMARLFGEADLFVATSRLDNLPNTVMEATACGIPTVAFRIGGMPDMIEHQRTGYLAEAFDADDLAAGISWALEDETRLRALKKAARGKAEREFGSGLQAERMLAIYDRAMRLAR